MKKPTISELLDYIKAHNIQCFIDKGKIVVVDDEGEPLILKPTIESVMDWLGYEGHNNHLVYSLL